MLVQVPSREVLWTPPAPRSTAMWKFMEAVNQKHGLNLEDYPGLYKWSIENIGAFWEDVWAFFQIRASHPFDKVRPRPVPAPLGPLPIILTMFPMPNKISRRSPQKPCSPAPTSSPGLS